MAHLVLVRPMHCRWCVACLIVATCGILKAGDIGPPVEVHPDWESRYHAISMPAPIPPYEARRQHLTVSGIIAVDVDTTTGLVTSATMKKSTGSSICDEASLSVTKKWRSGAPANHTSKFRSRSILREADWTRVCAAKGLTNRSS